MISKKTFAFSADPDYSLYPDSGKSLTEFLPVQDMGSSKNFASSSTSNDYCAYGVIRGRRLGGCLLSLNASGSCKCLSCLQIAEWGAV